MPQWLCRTVLPVLARVVFRAETTFSRGAVIGTPRITPPSFPYLRPHNARCRSSALARSRHAVQSSSVSQWHGDCPSGCTAYAGRMTAQARHPARVDVDFRRDGTGSLLALPQLCLEDQQSDCVRVPVTYWALLRPCRG